MLDEAFDEHNSIPPKFFATIAFQIGYLLNYLHESNNYYHASTRAYVTSHSVFAG